MKIQEKVKTKFRRDKEERDLALYRDYQDLISHEGAMPLAVDQYLMQKYGIFSRATIWNIRKRVEKRLAKEKEY